MMLSDGYFMICVRGGTYRSFQIIEQNKYFVQLLGEALKHRAGLYQCNGFPDVVYRKQLQTVRRL